MSEEAEVIVFEGAPLTGKSTQIGELEEILEEKGENVSVLKKESERCPSREEIDRLKKETDGFLREEISVERETGLWKKYYLEKNKVIKEERNRSEIDYVLVDRFALSLIPVQQPALDKTLDEMVSEYRYIVDSVDFDQLIVLEAEDEDFRERYSMREGGSVSNSFLTEIIATQNNYRELENYFDSIDYIETNEKSIEEVTQHLVSKLALDEKVK